MWTIQAPKLSGWSSIIRANGHQACQGVELSTLIPLKLGCRQGLAGGANIANQSSKRSDAVSKYRWFHDVSQKCHFMMIVTYHDLNYLLLFFEWPPSCKISNLPFFSGYLRVVEFVGIGGWSSLEIQISCLPPSSPSCLATEIAWKRLWSARITILVLSQVVVPTIFWCFSFSPLPEKMIQFDEHIFFKWVGSTTR